MKLIPKKLIIFPHISEKNWLNHHVIIDFLNEMAPLYASRILVDIGCGKKPYQSIFAPYVSRHIGVDLVESNNITSIVDIIGSAYKTTLQESFCETVLCTEVFEHLEDPLSATREMNRILKNNGIVILTVPFFWPIHDAPRDFYRYSEYGLRYLFENSGFEIVEIRPLTGFIVTFLQLSIYFLEGFQRGYILKVFGRFFNWGLQHLALKLNKYDKSTAFTNIYGLVARKTVHWE